MLLGAYLRRDRLIDQMAGARLVCLVGPGGYGKTSLTEELAEHLDAPLLRISMPPSADDDRVVAVVLRALMQADIGVAELSEIQNVDALGRHVAERLWDRSPMVVLIDDCHRALDATGRLCLALAGEESPHHVVLAGRVAADAVVQNDKALVLDHSELAFDASECQQLLGKRSDSWRAFCEGVSGWPLAVSFAATMVMPGPPSGGLDAERVLDSLLEEFLGAAGGRVERALETVAHLPHVRPGLVDAIAGAGSWDLLVESGLPMLARAESFALSDPIRARLRTRRPLDEADARSGARLLVADGFVAEAIDLLVGSGHGRLAADVLARLRLHELEQLSAVEMRALVTLIAADSEPDARLQLQLARLYDVEARIDDRRELLERLDSAPDESLATPLGRAVAGERSRDLARQSSVVQATELALAVLRAASPAETVTRVRALAAVGLAEAYGQRRGWAHRATDALHEAATVAKGIGERHMAAEAQMWLGFWVQFAAGSIEPAIASLRRAVDDAVPGSRRRGIVLTFLADALVRTGRADEAEHALDEAQRLGRLRYDSLTLAYDAWLRAEVATLRRDQGSLEGHLDEVERHRTDWWDHSTGADFLAAACEMWRRSGRADKAAEVLARAEQHGEGTMPTLRLAAATLAGELGDACAGADQLDVLLDGDGLFATDRLRALAVRAFAAQRSQAADSATWRDRAVQAEAALGAGSLLGRVEPNVAVSLGMLEPALVVPSRQPPHGRQLLRRATDDRRADLTADVDVDAAGIEVGVLGGFRVRRGTVDVRLPPGMAATLIKYLAVAGRPITADEVLDMLWPDEHVTVARRRLRNLLNRMKSQMTIQLVERVDDSVLRLRPEVEVDLHRFAVLADRALAADGDVAVRECRDALDVFASGLLPEDRYDDAFAGVRERLMVRRLDLLAHLARLASRAGQHQLVIWARTELVDAEPFDESRYIDLARALVRAQRGDAARDVVRRAHAVVIDLGSEPSDALRAIAATLDGRRGGTA